MFHNVKILFCFIVLSIKRKLNAWNTQQRLAILKKKKKKLQYRDRGGKNLWYRDRERGKKKIVWHRYRPPSVPSLDLDIFIDYENYKKIGYSFGSSL